MTVDQQFEARSRLRELAQQQDPHLFLGCAVDYLVDAPDDDPIRAQALRLLVQKGLHSVAEEVALACPPSSPVYTQLQSVAEQFATHRTDRIDWSETNDRFAANLQALRSRGQQAAALADRLDHAWHNEMPPDLTLHRAADGNWQVRCRCSDGRRIWLPALQDFLNVTEAIANAECFRGNFVAPLLLDGVGTGLLVPRLWTATHHTYLTYSAAIYLVEPNVRAIALALRLHDWTEALSDERLMIFAGPSAWTDWLGHLLADPELAEPSQVVSLARWPGDRMYPAADYREQLKQRRRARDQQERQRAEAVYTHCDVASWANRYASASANHPLRVLCMTSRHTTFLQHSTRDLMAALERAGLRAELLIEQRDYTVLTGPVCMRRFAEFRPDLVVVIDHHRHEMPDRFLQNVPFLCWIQDELPKLYAVEAGRSLGPLDFTMGFGRDICVSQFGYPAERFMPCPIVVEPAKFAPEPGAPAVDPQLQCDVAYIGHHAETPRALHERIRGQVEPPITRLIDAFYDEMMPRMQDGRFNGAYDLCGMLTEMEARARIQLNDAESRNRLLGLYVRPLADRVLRHATLDWVADWAENTGRSLRLYGLGWEDHPRLGKFARGVARHGAHLGAIVRSAAINLHFGLNLCLHQRVLETAAAGGFLLVRYHPHDFRLPAYHLLARYVRENGITRSTSVPLDRMPADYIAARQKTFELTGQAETGQVDIPASFLREIAAPPDERRRQVSQAAFPDLHRITFDSPECFAKQAAFYLEHADDRRAVVERMRQSVLDNFTYDALVSNMITFLRKLL